jgi:hypothetical protein
MSRTFRILFGDNEPGRHELFLELVIRKLEKRFGEGYSFDVDHSQSVDPAYEAGYDPWLLRKGAKSVRSFLAAGWEGDLVISDVNYDKKVKMGEPHTGADVGREIAAREKKLHWCEVIWMTRYTQEQTAQLHIEMGGILPGRSHFVEMSATDPEKNWDFVADLATRCLEDALVVRDGFSVPPDLYRVRLFHSAFEEAVCLTVWHNAKEICLYKHAFEGQDRDILLALHGASRKFLEQEPLVRKVRAQAKTRRNPGRDATANSVRLRVKKIRSTFPNVVDDRTEDPAEIRRAGKIHSGRHFRGVVCGACVLFNPEWGDQGYAFGGESDLRELPEAVSTDDVLNNPRTVWEQLGGAGAPLDESAKAKPCK